MKIPLDMNLTPRWVGFLESHGFEAKHWSAAGDPKAPDSVVMQWAREHAFVGFTNDLDFSALLAATRERGPSVIQVRNPNLLPEAIGHDVVRVPRMRSAELETGAIVTIDKPGARVRVLPILSRGGEPG